MDPPGVEAWTVCGEYAVAGVLAVERLELRERGGERIVVGAGGEAEQALGLRLAEIEDGVLRDVQVADASARQRVGRAPEAHEAPVRLEQAGVPGRRVGPRHRPAGVLAPGAFEPDLVSREDHRHPGA